MMPASNRSKPRHRRPRSRWRLVLVVAGLVLGLLASSVAALALYGERSIERPIVAGRSTESGPRMITLADGQETEILNVLLVGSDDRENLSAEDFAEIGGPRDGGRSDTLMLAQIEVGGSRAALLSFPRDLRVELCDGSTDKVNAALSVGEETGIGAESCLVRTVSEHTGIAIDHYVEIDFTGFMGVVEVLGGVTMYLEEPMIDNKAQLSVEAGCVTLTPEQALGFVRSRGYDDDFGRIARQQRFIREVLDQVTEVGTLANPARVVRLVNRAAEAVRTDEDLGLREMRDIAEGMRNLASSDVEAYTVPSEAAEIDAVSFVVQFDDEAESLYARFRDGSILQPEPEPTPVPTPTPTPVPTVPPVVVWNTTDVGGLAAAAGERLEAAGLPLAEVDNAPAGTLAGIEVLHAPGLEAAAAQVAAALPGASTRVDGDGDGVAVFLGSGVTLEALEAAGPVVAPTPAVTPSPSGPTSATPVPTPTTTGTPAPSPAATTSAAPTAEPTPTPTLAPTSRNAAPVDVDC